MAYSLQHNPLVGQGYGTDLAGDTEDLGRMLGPVMAGARARGVADALELLEIPAVLIDATGRVLHAGGRAERALLPLVKVVGGHLVGADARVNEALQRAIAAGIASREGNGPHLSIDLVDEAGRARLGIRVMRFPQGENEAVQLLRAVLVITEYRV